MTTWGITRSKNEVDIIESSIRRMLSQVDHVIIGDDSTDGTETILARLVAEGLPITLVYDDALSWRQREVMTAYAHVALDAGADWGVFFDIDEAWQADTGRITDRLADLAGYVLIAHAANLTHCATSRDDPADPDPMHRMGWRSVAKLPLGKIACRLRDDLHVDHGNHSASYDLDPHPATVLGVLESRHFPYRTPEQFIRRVEGSWPQLRDSGLPESHGAHMWAYGRCLDEHGPDGLRAWFADGMFFERPDEDPDLVFDPLLPLAEL